MKLHYLIIALLSVFMYPLGAQSYPKMDKPLYTYVYPKPDMPTCAPPSRMWDDTKWQKENMPKLWTDEAQNLVFYNHYKQIALKDGAIMADGSKVSRPPSNFMSSRVVLCIRTLFRLSEIERKHNKKIDRLYINYGHADDYSYFGMPAAQLPDSKKRMRFFDSNMAKRRYMKDHWIPSYGYEHETDDASKMKERVFTLDKLKERGTKVYIYNKFYNIPNYIRNHENVSIVIDEKKSSYSEWEPNYYSFTDNKGRTINAGFYGIPYYPHLGFTRKTNYNRGIIALKVNGTKHHYYFKNLSEESQRKVLSLMGNYNLYVHNI